MFNMSARKLHEEILLLLKEAPRSIRQLHKILLDKKILEVRNPMFLSGYLRAMEDLDMPIAHTESGGATFYYLKSKSKNHR